jgi:hypothetical protein
MSRPRRSRLVTVLAAVIALVCAPALAQGPVAAPLPVTRVVLFTTGVGYFEHTGTVEGTQEVDLLVAHEHMDDLLQSLVLEDLDGGSVHPVRYGSRDPLSRALSSYALDLSGDPTLAELLAQARGEALRVEAGETFEGVLVNVEHAPRRDGGVVTLLTLSTDAGLRRVPLDEVRTITFERETVRADLAAALAAIVRARDAEANVVRLRFEGVGERRVRVGYVREMPVWKTTYRLVLGEDGRADLQGWAIFDNPTNLDLVDVQVAFVAGRPVSFVSALFAPVYVTRPRVAAASAQGVVPPVDAGAFAPAARSAAMAEAAAPAPAPTLRNGGVSAMASGATTGTAFAYVVAVPVSVGRFESAMIPLLVTDVPATRVSFHPSGASPGAPYRAARIVNDTGLHLAAGPVTFYDAAGFAGTAMVSDLPPGGERLLSFAIDLGAHVATESRGEAEGVVSVTLRGGVLETVQRSRLRTSVDVVATDGLARVVVVDVPRRPGYEVVAPPEGPWETPDALRFVVALGADAAATAAASAGPVHARCEPDATCRLDVVFERLESRTLALAAVDAERLAVFLENPTLGPREREAIEAVVSLQRRLVAAGRDLSAIQSRTDAVFRDQERIRQNMLAIDRASSLYARYLADLAAQEDELVVLQVRREEIAAHRRALQEELDELLADLAANAD